MAATISMNRVLCRRRFQKGAECFMPVQKVPCVKCTALILPATAQRTNGLCMPCAGPTAAIHFG